MAELLAVDDLVVNFTTSGGFLSRKRKVTEAVSHVSFAVSEGESFGLVGESGSGKSTIARTIMGLNPVTSGDIRLRGVSLLQGSPRVNYGNSKEKSQEVQMIFQDARSALNPWMTIRQCVEEVWRIDPKLLDRTQWAAEAASLMERVGLNGNALEKLPHQFSGGQLQRVGLARALAAKPQLIVCDEPVSGLDVSIQGQILNLLVSVQREFGTAFLFIGHDLSVMRSFSDRVGVMQRGKLVEMATSDQLFANPSHPYTKLLLSSVPNPQF